MPSKAGPFCLGATGGLDGAFDVCRAALADLGQHRARSGVLDFEGLTGGGECAVNEMAEAIAMAIEPSQGLCGAFGRGAVVHGFKEFASGHGRSPIRLKFDPACKPVCLEGGCILGGRQTRSHPNRRYRLSTFLLCRSGGGRGPGSDLVHRPHLCARPSHRFQSAPQLAEKAPDQSWGRRENYTSS